jgi:hypothetical protein
MEAELELEELGLMAILAATDAVFVPSRHPLSHAHRVRCERRRAAGVAWSSAMVIPSRSAAARKQAERVLDELVARGWVKTIQPNHAKTLAVQLTDLGDEHARALAGLPRVETTLEVLGQIKKLQVGEEVCEVEGRVWVPETALTGVRWGDNTRRKAFVELEEKLLPGLVRHWVRSNCSIQGHCWYTLGDAAPWEIPALRKAPEANVNARAEYYLCIHVEIEMHQTAKLECEREIGDIPLPVCGVWR